MPRPLTRAASEEPAEGGGQMAGEYRLGRKLGEGGFGTVYEAEHPLLKRRAAVKVLHRVAEQNSEALQRFIAEAQAVNQIRNRHIIDIFSFGKLVDGRHFYVMDLLDGEPLDRYLARAGCLDLALTVQLLRPLAEALDLAHAAGIVHRDLKPQNIFLAWDEHGTTSPVLLDFGIAKLLGDSPVRTVSGTPLGTPSYMSPEQARGEKVDGRADIYSLGVLCHELLTGELPITGDTTVAVLMAHIAQAPPRASDVRPELPAEVDEPVLRMLAKKPDERPATAHEAIRGLAEAAERAGIAIAPGLPTLPRPVPTPGSRPGEFSNTLASPEAGGIAKLAVGARQSGAETRTARQRMGWLLVLVVLSVGAAAAWVLGSRSEEKSAPPARSSLPDHPPPTPAAAEGKRSPGAAPPPASAGVPAGAPAADDSATPPARGEQRPAQVPDRSKKRTTSTRRKDVIPSDLESPF